MTEVFVEQLGYTGSVKNMSPLACNSELLKAATMRPHGRAKVFRDCARFGFLNAKMHNLPLFHLFWVSFQFLCWFLGHLVCATLLNGNIGHAKKFAFRRSAYRRSAYRRSHPSNEDLE